MTLEAKPLEHLDKLLVKTQDSFHGLSARWDDLQPRKSFNVKISEDFHLGFIFGKLEDDFINWFYSQHGRSMTDKEYVHFWKQCRNLVRSARKI